MPVYLWEGKNKKGEVRKGEMEVASEEAVRSQLTRMKINPTKIKKKPKDIFENVEFLQPKVTENDVIVFCRQFSTMIDAGLPIIQCLDILFSQHLEHTYEGGKIDRTEIERQIVNGSVNPALFFVVSYDRKTIKSDLTYKKQSIERRIGY